MEVKKIHLHGKLADLVPGGVFEGAWNTPQQAAGAIEVSHPGFRKAIEEMDLLIWCGENTYLSADQLEWTVPGDLHIAPAVTGEKGNALKIIIGVALFAIGIGAALATGGLAAGLAAPAFGNALGITAGQIALFGASMIFMGLSMPPTPNNDFGGNEDAQATSVIYRGPANNQEPGAAYPLVYGFNVMAGGVAINTMVDIVQREL